MAGVVTTLAPPQVASDDANLGKTVTTAHVAGTHTVTEVITIKKLTSNGTTGSITLVNGKQTAYVAPT